MNLLKNKLALTSLTLFLLAIGCTIAYNIIGSYVDEDEFLNEPFFLIPIGYLLAFVGLIFGIAAIARAIFQHKK